MALDLFDTHCHVQMSAFDEDRADTLARAVTAGVRGLVNVGVDVETSRAAAELAGQEEFCWASAGLHPHDAESWTLDVRRELADIAAHPGVVAIGEAGLDYYRDLAPRAAQTDAFRGQIELSVELGLPLIIHNREPTADILMVLHEYGGDVRALLHCFGGTREDAERALEIGCVLGIGGVVTYPKSQPLRDVVAGLPDGTFVLETDSPWLTPQFRRGKRNEPAYVAAVAHAVAEARGVSADALAQSTTATARHLFGIDAHAE